MNTVARLNDVTLMAPHQPQAAQAYASGHSIDDHLNYLDVPIDVNGC
jgi:hypothetical protein